MKKKRFIFSSVLVFILLLILFTICIEYKIEENRIKETLDSGEVYINNKKVKLPISINDFEKKFGTIKFQSEFYDGDNYFYYDGYKKESNSIGGNVKLEGILLLKKQKIGMFVTNIKNTKQKLSNCYITGIRIGNDSSTKLFKKINLDTSKKELDKIMYTGKLSPFKHEYKGLEVYSNYYNLEITHNNGIITDIIYDFNYDECKDDGCSKYIN